jgi:hypothetical protein
VHCRRAQLALARARSASCAEERAICLDHARRELETALEDAASVDAGADSDLMLDIRRRQAEVEEEARA